MDPIIGSTSIVNKFPWKNPPNSKFQETHANQGSFQRIDACVAPWGVCLDVEVGFVIGSKVILEDHPNE